MFHVKHPLSFLDDALADLARAGLLRQRRAPVDLARSFCSNDYLGLASETAPAGAAGAGASRLIAGERDEHLALELEVAAWLKAPAALAFTSGYAANVGAIAALAGAGDRIVSDALNHASIVDGARLSRAEVVVTPHLDVEAVERALALPCRGRQWVVTESYFSMDADAPDLRSLRRACDAANAALYVDEAHALGVLGPGGRGLAAEQEVTPDITVGTFGKAFGAGGAFVAGSDSLVRWLWNRARSFVFSTGLSPQLAAAARLNVARAQGDPSLAARTLQNASRLRDGLAAIGIVPLGFGHIVPWLEADTGRALALSAALAERGQHVLAVRPPTVPTSRLRLAVTAAHGDHDIDALLRAVAECVACLPR